MDHKYKSLLQNIPTRHVITAIAKDGEREQQIEKLRNLDINNFFILGTLQSIKLVLGKIDNTVHCPFYEKNEEAPWILINLFFQNLQKANISKGTSLGTLSPSTRATYPAIVIMQQSCLCSPRQMQEILTGLGCWRLPTIWRRNLNSFQHFILI